jgi:HTH-type transcriptional regulator/antitoxin HipB
MRVESVRDLGAVARRRREQLGWSQSHLAQATATTRQWISRFESGASDVTLERALAVLSALKLSVDILRPGEMVPTSDPFARIREQLRSIEAPQVDFEGINRAVSSTLRSADFRRTVEQLNKIALTVPRLEALRVSLPERNDDG